MDKEKEIEKMACDMCLWRQGCNSPNEPIDTCKPLHMAKKAVEAGYGDVRAAVKEFAESVKMVFYYEFDELIPSTMADKIDELVKEVCGDELCELVCKRGIPLTR